MIGSGTFSRKPVVAIDGPSGAGKSTVGRRLAQRLKFRYIDTGAIYRALAFIAQEAGIDWNDEAGLSTLVTDLPIQFRWQDGENRIFLRGVDHTAEIRNEEMGIGASTVSRWPLVRTGLLALQRQLGEQGGVVMDGRDIGTVVFPDADMKFFLSASAAERARRRHEELLSKGSDVPLEQVASDLEARDRRDTQREAAPLRQAEDAIPIDSTGHTIDEIVEHMARLVEALMSR